VLNTNEVRIETCTKCMYSCIFCPRHKLKRKKETMSLDTYCFIVDKIKKELPDITGITISGFGEAFLDDSICEKIEYTSGMGYQVYIVSNGYFLTKGTIDRLRNFNVENIRISLHSIEYKPYQKLTRAPLTYFYRVIQNIDYIIEKSDIPLILTFEIVPGINDNQIEQIKKRYDGKAVVEIWKPHNWISTYEHRKGPITRSTCGRPWNSPYQLQVDGTLNMCCFDYNGELLLGDFLKQTMEEILNGDAFLDLKKHHKNGTLDETDYLCKDCDQRKCQDDIIIYNNKFTAENRLDRTSTNYARIK